MDSEMMMTQVVSPTTAGDALALLAALSDPKGTRDKLAALQAATDEAVKAQEAARATQTALAEREKAVSDREQAMSQREAAADQREQKVAERETVVAAKEARLKAIRDEADAMSTKPDLIR